MPIPTLTDVGRIVSASTETHQSYADHITISTLLAAHSSEIAGLMVGDVDWASKLVIIERQCFPGSGGLTIKPTKNRRVGRVPIIEPLEPTLRRHDLPHAGATWFANAGIPIHVVSHILGHTSVETTRAYLHTDNTELRKVAARMNQHLRTKRSTPKDARLGHTRRTTPCFTETCMNQTVATIAGIQDVRI